MKAVVLCGGEGTRLRPLTRCVNKNLLPVGNKPMIMYPLERLKSAGVVQVCIITGAEHMGDVVDLLRSGSEHGLDITYRVQEKPNGISAAISLAEDFVNNDQFIVILGDNVFDADLTPLVRKLEQTDCACVLVKEVSDPERFGVVAYDSYGKIVDILEKPKCPPSNDIVIGVYGYQANAFDHIRTLKPSARGEYEVTDLNNCYLREGKLLVEKIDGFWIDCGTFPTLEAANKWAWENK